MAFHTHGGWFFERLADGSVHQYHRRYPEDVTDQEIWFSVDEWASVVATVSAFGEDLGTFEQAKDFHSGVVPAPPAVDVPLGEPEAPASAEAA